MDKVLYDSLCRYFATLAKVGNVSYNSVDKLLVLMFYKHFVYEDYRGYLSKDDYRSIEMALDCLFGSTCLIPYPDYLKMGKLHLGEITEMAQRVKTLEDTDVVKVMHDFENADNVQSDVMIVTNDE